MNMKVSFPLPVSTISTRSSTVMLLLLLFLPAAKTFCRKMAPSTAIPNKVMRRRAMGMPGHSIFP